jgi:hypothetical protein
VKRALAAFVVALATAAAFASVGSATNECKGIQTCIRVAGPWVVVPAHASVQFLLSCPQGRGVVGGLDAQVTSRSVRVGFEGRLGAPVQPGVTTTRYALFTAVSAAAHVQAFQPLLGCIPVQGGGGRSTVSATVTPPGPSLEYRANIAIVGPGTVRFARAACLSTEKLVGSWHALAFRTKKPPDLANASRVQMTTVALKRRVVVTVAASDGLSIDVHAVVQAGVECAP